MCPPDKYGVHYSINPWMDTSNNVDQSLAKKQWLKLYSMIIAYGHDVQTVIPGNHCPDMVFTANAGLVIGHKFIASQFRHVERQTERTRFREWFSAHGYEDITPGWQAHWEGAGDLLYAGKFWVGGYGFRSVDFSHRIALDDLGMDISSLLPVKLIDERFYHLDTCFCPLRFNGDRPLVMYYPNAFDERSRHEIEEKFETIHASEDEAKSFCCNAVVLEDIVLMPESESGRLSRLLKDKYKFKVVTLEMTEFIKSGGACKCLVLQI